MRVLLAITHVLGTILGVLLLPVTLAFVLRNRLHGHFHRAFHPDGEVYAGHFAPLVPEGDFLDGPALARLSATMTRGEAEEEDILGLAVRFGARLVGTPAQIEDHEGMQDLLAASFTSFAPKQLARAKARTNVHDFLDNDYQAVARYFVPGVGLCRLRWTGLRRAAAAGGTGTRGARLDEAIAAEQARFVLEASQGVDAWLALGVLALEAHVVVPERRLAFSPFRSGRGVRATGFLNGLRRTNYVLSRVLRRTERA